MGLFSKGSKAVATVAVAAATAATSSIGGGLAKQYVQSQRIIDSSRNVAAKVITKKSN